MNWEEGRTSVRPSFFIDVVLCLLEVTELQRSDTYISIGRQPDALFFY